MHSDEDEIIPITSAKRLFDSISHDRKKFIEIKGKHPNPVVTVDNMQELCDFVGINSDNCVYASGVLDYLRESV